MIPGELLAEPGELELNVGRPTITLVVANTGDRPIQVGSHYHFHETNAGLAFDREAARGYRLDIAAGTAVRFEPGQTRTVQLRRADVQAWLVEGFWPLVDAQERPSRRQGALRGLGLPYPADAAITRHLAGFLRQHAAAARAALGMAPDDSSIPVPDTLLLNGGVFRAPALAQRLEEHAARAQDSPVWFYGLRGAAQLLRQPSSDPDNLVQ